MRSPALGKKCCPTAPDVIHVARLPSDGTAMTTHPLDFEPVPVQPRFDGWTADRQRTFIRCLAETGCMKTACAEVGITPRSAYRLREHPRAAGFRAAPGVLMVPLQQEFGWSTTVLSAAVSINLVLFGLTAPFAAALMERFGVRAVTATALVLIGAGSAPDLETDDKRADERHSDVDLGSIGG